ncbi:MAG: LPS export ABC transporter periplasmic protein LptC [Shimia sp.]|uniref:LPS export ABC transporter periplasmic protein LptC n=1 Tax=Shimia sp. TaxID=1954381 RepID=UPI0040581D72
MAGGFTYSNMVALLKVILPLLALGLLATMFLVPRTINLESAIPFADVELETRLRDQQVTAPSFSSQTGRGHLVAVTAAKANPDPEEPARIVAEDLDTRITLTNGQLITVLAEHGEMDGAFQDLLLEDGVQITTSSGLKLDTDSLIMSLDEVRAETGGPVSATLGIGQLDAGRMAIRPAGESDDIYLFFTKGVRLLYTPQTTTKDP